LGDCQERFEECPEIKNMPYEIEYRQREKGNKGKMPVLHYQYGSVVE
jgi:hypothetical protein